MRISPFRRTPVGEAEDKRNDLLDYDFYREQVESVEEITRGFTLGRAEEGEDLVREICWKCLKYKTHCICKGKGR